MTIAIGHAAAITDAAGRAIGRFEVEERDGNRLSGTFHPGPDFPAVAGPVYEFADLVEDQVLSLVDQAQEAIAGLGLRMNGTPVWDVQIYRDGAASFRLPPTPADRNGTHP